MGILDCSGEVLEHLRGVFGGLLGGLGGVLDSLGDLLGVSWAILGDLGVILGGHGSSWVVLSSTRPSARFAKIAPELHL